MRVGDAGDVKLLSGGNPQVAKGDGNEVVQSYIAAMPDWKHDIGVQIDRLVTDLVPDVQKKVRWNTPFYGVEDNGWFLSFHCFDNYVKATWHNGTQLDPQPPVGSKVDGIRYLHVSPDDPLDVDQFTDWVRQACELPGEHL